MGVRQMDDQMTTRQRASAILSAAKMRMLEEAGITVVSREEWYQMQANLAEMRNMLEKIECLLPSKPTRSGYVPLGDVTRLQKMAHIPSDAGKAFAERVQALEKFYNATTKRDALLSQKNPHSETLDFEKDQAWWHEMAELLSQAEGAIAEAVEELEATK